MAPKAPATEPGLRQAALVLCAHGSRGVVGAAAEHALRIARLGWFGEVHACALKGEPELTRTLAAVRAPSGFLAPLLMAEGFTLRAMLSRLDHAGASRTRLTVCRPVGMHPRLAGMIAAKALALSARNGWPAADTALLIAGHGTERHPDSGASARRHAAEIRAQNVFAEVALGFLDQAPRISDALAGVRARHCVVVGLFVDRGEHGEEDIPKLLAAAGGRAAYAGPIGPDPLIIGLILDEVQAALKGALAA
jgi:sirohydrochlorin cobaltochelatase